MAYLPGKQEELGVSSCDQQLTEFGDELDVSQLKLGSLLAPTHGNAGLTLPCASPPHLHMSVIFQ